MQRVMTTSLVAMTSSLTCAVMAQERLADPVEPTGHLICTNSYPYGINRGAHVSGESPPLGASCNARAFLWENGALAELPVPIGTCCTWARRLNDLGEVAGVMYVSSTQFHAALWPTPTSMPIDLGTMGGPGTTSATNDINNQGEACGWTDVIGAPHHAMLWTGQIMRDLDTLGGSMSEGTAINDNGIVVGWSHDVTSRQRAFIWRPPFGPMIDLGALVGGSSSVATDLSENNIVVGWSGAAGDGVQHAFRWTQGQGMTELGRLCNGWATIANGISPNGQLIVGESGSCAGERRAVLWAFGIAPVDLNRWALRSSGWTLNVAHAVNDMGQVVGYGTRLGVGPNQGFVLTPVTTGLSLFGPTPGAVGVTNSLDVLEATPGAQIQFYYSFRSGSTVVPNCPGLFLALNQAVPIDADIADEHGRAMVQAYVPPFAAGKTVRIQAVDTEACQVTKVVVYRFPN